MTSYETHSILCVQGKDWECTKKKGGKKILSFGKIEKWDASNKDLLKMPNSVLEVCKFFTAEATGLLENNILLLKGLTSKPAQSVDPNRSLISCIGKLSLKDGFSLFTGDNDHEIVLAAIKRVRTTPNDLNEAVGGETGGELTTASNEQINYAKSEKIVAPISIKKGSSL